METTVGRAEGSLVVRLPQDVAQELGLKEGSSVNVTVEGGRLIVAPLHARYRLEDLLAQVTPENRHDEIDWGEPRGRESW